MENRNYNNKIGKVLGFKYEHKKHVAPRILIPVIMLFGIIYAVVFYNVMDIEAVLREDVFSIALCIGTLIGCLFFCVVLSIDRLDPDESLAYFFIMLFVLYVVIFAECMSRLEDGDTRFLIENEIYTFVSFMGSPFLCYLFWQYQRSLFNPNEKRNKKISCFMFILLLGYLVMLIVNLKRKFLYDVGDDGHYVIAKFYGVSFIIPTIMLIVGLISNIRIDMPIRKRLAVIFSFFMPIISFATSILTPEYAYTYVIIFCVMILLYGTTQVERNIEMLQKREEVAIKNALIAKKNEELMHKEQQIMVSQINPHFLFNTLTTIDYLCKTNPKLASETVVNLASYLRVNVDTLTQTETVAFKKELQHVKYYIAIEKLRFSNITIDFEILDDDFELPPLTVQPLVENAIRYGVRGVPNGHIKIMTYFSDGGHVILIEDNGVGFDVNEKINDGKTHVGIESVKKRLQITVNGKMKIESVKGKGTKIIIFIP